jgi:hypothetical protein
MINTNLISNSSFVNNTTGWTGNNVTLLRTTAKYLYGSSCLSLTATSTSNTWAFTSGISVTVGEVYTLSSYVLSAATSRNMYAQITWYDASSTAISSSTGTSTASSTGDWTRLTVTGTAPALAVTATCYVVITSPLVSEVHYVDAVKFENNTSASPFVEPINQTQENSKTNDVLRPVYPPHLTGIELNADIMINNLLLNTVDSDNVLWVCTDIKGWWGLPDPDIIDLTRGLDDGSYDVRGRYTARILTLEGSILVPNRSYTAAARDKLIAAINLVATGGWLHVNEDPTKSAYVRLNGRPNIEVVNARGRIDFSVGLKAANPVKFKWNWNDANGYTTQTVSTSSNSTITNEGNFYTPMVLSMVGGSAGLTAPITVQNTTTGKTLTVIKNIRGSSYSETNSTTQVSSEVVTVSFGATVHSFLVGDIVNVAGITTSGRTGLNTTGAVITNVTSTTISFSKSVADLASAATNGTVTLASADVLEIDTYNKSATFNGSPSIARSYIDTLTDWVILEPGPNVIDFTPTSGSTNLTVKYRSGWIG